VSETISCCLIARNCADTLPAALKSIKGHVDEIVVVLAGESTDNTPAIAKKYADIVEPFEWIDDFSAARNFSFSLASGDWLFWIDSDDVVENPQELRKLIVEAPKNVVALWMPYFYSVDGSGNVNTMFDRERLLRASYQWKWESRIHETAAPQVTGGVYARTDDVIIKHQRNAGDRSERNLALLELELKDNPDAKRPILYTAHQLFHGGKWAEALKWYKRFFETDDVVDLERWQALIYGAFCLRELKLPQMAIDLATRAMHLFPSLADSYLEIAQASYDLAETREQFEKAMEWLEVAKQKDPPPTMLIVNPLQYSLNIKSLEAHIQMSLEHPLEAYEAARDAHEIDPSLLGLERLWLLCRESARRLRERDGVIRWIESLVRHNELIKAERLRSLLPWWLNEDRRVLSMFADVDRRMSHVRDPEVYVKAYEENPHWKFDDRYFEPGALLKQMPRMRWIVDRLVKAEAKRVVDVGPCDGALMIELARHGIKSVGIETMKKGIRRGKRKAKKHGVADMIEWHNGLFEDVDPDVFLDKYGPVDAIILGEVLEHVENPAGLVSKAEEIAPRVLITVPDEFLGWGDTDMIGDNLHGHIRRFTLTDLILLMAHPAHGDRLINELRSIPDPNSLDPGMANFCIEIQQGSYQGKPVARFYLGPSVHYWDAESPEKEGIGGSETATIKLAKHLVEMGWNVFVYAEANGVSDGVFYRPHAMFEPDQPSDLFISSRRPMVFDEDINARVSWLMCHDTDYGPEITPERMEKVDRVLALSKWHKGHLLEQYPWMEPDKITVTANGIDLERFQAVASEQRHPYRFIWCSSPDRGLEHVLELWPSIRNKYPKAELHIFYGFKNMQIMAQGRPFLRPLVDRLSRGIGQDGIVFHDKVGQNELARWMARSSYWLYPNHPFEETYCITALECQASGVICIARDNGALPETVAGRGVLVPNGSDNAKWLYAIEEIVSDTEKRRALRKAGYRFAGNQTWMHRAVEWARMAKADIKAKEETDNERTAVGE
jgi:glycosyltransferase involved in cell wall biosynthesis